jgi:hypothetical protein
MFSVFESFEVLSPNRNMANLAIGLLQLLITYFLCILYNFILFILITIVIIYKRDSRIWKVKERSLPKVLQSKEFGEHKYAKVNVSDWLIVCG